jgi:PAS domain S-box-containing protein
MLEAVGREILQAVVDRIEAGVYALDLNHKVVYWNYGAQKLTGYLRQEVLGRPCDSFVVEQQEEHNPVVCTHQCPIESGTGENKQREVVTYLRHRGGHVIPVRLWTIALKNATGEIVGAMKVFSEHAVAAESSAEEASRQRHWTLDPETGVAVRTDLETFVREQIQVVDKQQKPCGLILIRLEKLDDFRRAHGSEAVGAIMHEVSRSLKDMVRRTDLLGRAGAWIVSWPCCRAAGLIRWRGWRHE